MEDRRREDRDNDVAESPRNPKSKGSKSFTDEEGRTITIKEDGTKSIVDTTDRKMIRIKIGRHYGLA